MNPQIKARWVAKLLSNEYAQGKGQLRNEKNEFCCLGVLCNLHAQDHPESAQYETDPGEYGGRNQFPPVKVMEWAGLDKDDPEVVLDDGRTTTLSQANDGNTDTRTEPYTFAEIAKLIKEQL